MNKKTITCSIVIISHFATAMDIKNSDTQYLSALINNVLFSMPEEIVVKGIKAWLGFQAIGRLKQVSKMCNKWWNVGDICPDASDYECACKCPTPACSIVGNYGACTKILQHYAEIGDKEMFCHFWHHDHEFRKTVIFKVFEINYYAQVEHFMEVYAGRYVHQREIDQINLKRLIHALSKRDVKAKTLLTLIGSRFDVFLPYKKNCTLLQRVCQLKKVSLLEALLGANYAINDTNEQRVSVLHKVVLYGTVEMVQNLLDRNVRVNVFDQHGQTPLHYAAKKGRYAILCTLLEHKDVIVDVRCAIRATPLYYAARRGGLRSVRELVKKGADVNAKTIGGVTPLHIAVEKGKISVADFLLQHDALVDATDYEKRTPLHYVFCIEKNPQERKRQMIDLLLKHNANPDACDKDGRNALYFARS